MKKTLLPLLCVVGGLLLIGGGYSLKWPKEATYHPLHWEWIQLLRKGGQPDVVWVFLGIFLFLTAFVIWFRESAIGE